ncbi:MAG: hypothetical protein J6T10_06720 [Methanobrevibacter sp.]|nr:hypothetical protein [Methanobrevibacter sp.]
MNKSKYYLILYDNSKDKQFIKYFDTEYELDKFKKKLHYSNKIYIIKDSRSVIFDYEK